MNKDEPITFIAHSMGALMVMVFLQGQTDSWKTKYIARMISISGPWGGSAKSLKTFAVGDDLGAFFLRAATMREEEISMPSLSFLLPFPVFWDSSEVLVRTRIQSYTYSHMREFFDDLGYLTGWEMRQDNLKYVENVDPPNVEIHCLFGSNVDTIEV
jgi:lysophospholipase III